MKIYTPGKDIIGGIVILRDDTMKLVPVGDSLLLSYDHKKYLNDTSLFHIILETEASIYPMTVGFEQIPCRVMRITIFDKKRVNFYYDLQGCSYFANGDFGKRIKKRKS